MYERILIVVDQREFARAALQEGLRLAALHGSEVTFFTMQPSYPLPIGDVPLYDGVSTREFEQAAKAGAERVLAAAHVAADKAGVVARGSVGKGDDPVQAAVDIIKRRKIGLAVVASEGRNALMRLLTGSIIPGLITQSPVPVLIVKSPARQSVRAHAAAVKLAGVRGSRGAPKLAAKRSPKRVPATSRAPRAPR
jgi:nucleotide-binding universal stress UspA family protein